MLGIGFLVALLAFFMSLDFKENSMLKKNQLQKHIFDNRILTQTQILETVREKREERYLKYFEEQKERKL